MSHLADGFTSMLEWALWGVGAIVALIVALIVLSITAKALQAAVRTVKGPVDSEHRR